MPEVMSALWTVCSVCVCVRVCVCKVEQTVCVSLLIAWFNCTSSMLMNVHPEDRCVKLCRTVSHLYTHDTEPLHHRYTRRGLLKQVEIWICMLNTSFILYVVLPFVSIIVRLIRSSVLFFLLSNTLHTTSAHSEQGPFL